MMNMKDEYVMMESIFNENKDVYLEEKINDFNNFKDFFFKKMGFKEIPTNKTEWQKLKKDESNKNAFLKLSNFITEKTGAGNASELKTWISKKIKIKNSTFDSLKNWLLTGNKLSTTYAEEHVISEMTANGIAMTIPISYVIFVLLMVFMEDTLTGIKNNFFDKKK